MEESGQSYDEELFIRPDGEPMVFCLLPDTESNKYREELVSQVHQRGGVVLDQLTDVLSHHCIRLLGKYENPDKRKEMFDYRYVVDCIQKDRVLDNMLDYRVSKSSIYQQYEKYEPLDILHGYKKWTDLTLREEGERVSDIDDDFETSSFISIVMDRSKASSMKTFKSPYTRKNQEEIVKALVRFSAYRLVRGNTIWKQLEGIGICNGIRTWQSMKEHFRKKIIQEIHTFGLSWRQVRRFRATYGLDELRDSDIDSGEEEGVDNEANYRPNTPKSNSERAFKPRRTSSPVLAAAETAARPADASQCDLEMEVSCRQTPRQSTSKQPARPSVPSTSSRTVMETPAPAPTASSSPKQTVGVPVVQEEVLVAKSKQTTLENREEISPSKRSPSKSSGKVRATKVASDQLGEKPSNNSVEKVQENEGESPRGTSTRKEKQSESLTALNVDKRSGKRKRKLFSNNNSYLDDDGNSNKVNATPEKVTPSKKRRVLSTLDETHEEELVSVGQRRASIDIDAGKIPEVIMNDAIDQHQDTMEEVFGPGVSPLCLSPVKRKSKYVSDDSGSDSDCERSKSKRKMKNADDECLKTKTVTKDKQGKPLVEARPPTPSPSTSPSPGSSVQEAESLTRRDSVGSSSSRGKEGSPSSSGTNKENMNRDFWYKTKHRTPFSRGEEETMVKYFLRKGGYSTKGGNTVWKRMEEDWICPGRTWQSLRERFEKHIDTKLRQFGVSRQQLLDRDKELNKSSNSGEAKKPMRNYTKQEDLMIIQFICDNKRFADVKGNEVWKLMEERKVVDGRSWQSLKERYKKIIMRNINKYSLDSEVIAMFTSSNSKKGKKLSRITSNMVREFIEGWDLVQVLGEGTFGEVKLLVNKVTGEACAMKEIDINANPEAEETVKKEICVHKLLKHKQIVQCYGSRQDGSRQFIFLEYCSGGELFDRIEPDVGMPEHQAQRFFIQIMSGLEYLHKKGVSHRDIKPENLLLDENDCLKISDFGMATVFRHQGKERLLERRCGTMPYIAPEVLVRSQYNAEPADLWSCGVVLVAMLTGELPWDKPTSDQVEYCNWKDSKYEADPWKKIDNLPLSLLRKILMPLPSRRYKLEQILNHIWVKKKLKDSEMSLVRSNSSLGVGKRLCGGPVKPEKISLSQPADLDHETEAGDVQEPAEVFHGFTQPAQLDNMLVSTQGATQSSQTSLQKLVKRMTRFWVKTDLESTEKELKQRLASLKYQSKVITPGIVTISCMDRRASPLVFKATLIEMDKQVLLDFRLSRGDGIEFKRNFIKIRKTMETLIVKGPIMWSLAIHSNSLPGV